ncbi:unknown [Eubacterium sp. CAG:161]|nr:unknown [Eubacterium sp. CAG:161]
MAISATTTLPAISLPAGNASFDLCSLNSFEFKSSFKYTGSLPSFGISIPTAAFPGIGASIRMSAAAIFNFMSSARPVIRLTLVPISGCNSYLVTDGPLLTFVTSTLTPKFAKTCFSLLAVCIRDAFVIPLLLPGLSLRRLYGGFLYFIFFLDGAIIFPSEDALGCCEMTSSAVGVSVATASPTPKGFLFIVFLASSLTITLSFGVNSPSVACLSAFGGSGLSRPSILTCLLP